MSTDPDLSEIAARNRSLWDERSAEYQQAHGEQLAASGGAAWGLWQIPESELRVLGEVAGRDVLELGCGAAQWSIALHRQGARMTALDNSARQLAHAHSELRPPTDAKSSYRDDADRDWAQRWPMEHIWRVRRAADINRR